MMRCHNTPNRMAVVSKSEVTRHWRIDQCLPTERLSPQSLRLPGTEKETDAFLQNGCRLKDWGYQVLKKRPVPSYRMAVVSKSEVARRWRRDWCLPKRMAVVSTSEVKVTRHWRRDRCFPNRMAFVSKSEVTKHWRSDRCLLIVLVGMFNGTRIGKHSLERDWVFI